MKTETRNILENKWYLYLTSFFAGVSIMAVELAASRLLAPYFSSSQIVWTMIIGTIMIAMALGNVWGGRSADKDPNPDKLYMRFIIAAIWIAAIPFIGKYIILGISALLIVTVSHNLLVLAAFISCIVIFAFPLFLLGTTTPSLVKYSVDSLDDSGKVVGTLGAFQTIGSIIGTFLPTFLTIPTVGTAITFLIFSGILLIIGFIYFFSKKIKIAKCMVATLLFLIFGLFGTSNSFAFWEKDLLYEGESVYNYLQVKDTQNSVILSTNVLFGVQSIMKKDTFLTGMYYDYALAAPLMTGITKESNGDVLILGMGTGTYARQCTNYFENLNIEGVEIDQKITALASEYFALPNTINVTTYDGRAFLHVIDKKYDVIMIDAYQDITIPFQMSSIEFFELVKTHLKDNGVMIVNMNMYSDQKDNINDYLADTIADVFDYIYTVDVTSSTNTELFASQNKDMVNVLLANIESLSEEDLKMQMQKVAFNLVLYKKGDLILTDDKAPVELLGMKVVDDLIEKELIYYKAVYKEKGIQGLLE